MQKLRLAAVALNQTPLDWEGNARRIRTALAEARDAGAAVVCLPELCVTGYGCEDAFLSTGVPETALDLLVELLPATAGMIVALGMPLVVDGPLFNAAALACDGRLLGFALKQHLAGDGLHYEPRWFRKWPAARTATVSVGGDDYPAGDLLFNCGGVKIGFEICRDAWVADRPGSRLAAGGADVILNPSASHFAFAKQEVRRRFVLEGSRTFNTSFVYCNLLGNEAGRAIFDGGTLIATAGKTVAEGPRLSFAEHVVTLADVSVTATRRLRAALSEPSRAPEPFDGGTVQCDFAPATPVGRCPAPAPRTWEGYPAPKEEEFARAVPLALYDYLRKSRAGGLVVSLSGGADSSAVATIVWLMAKLGREELGHAEFAARLPAVRGLAETSTAEEAVGRILACVYQATRNSSDVTRNAAEAVATAVGAQFHEWEVDSMVDGYVAAVSRAVGRDLSWESDDLALQNIQARARGPAAWLLANLTSSLLLATSNRSEAAVGYATMDGDTCGGLAPIAGIDKAFLLKWLAWMETTGPVGVGSLPALSVVTAQQPTAELRPPAEGQTDEGDLMPYAVLDAIERAAIRDKLMPVEVFDTLAAELPDVSADQLAAWIERFFRLWCRNQWKRERFAPAFHVDDENLDPKTWCRFPILSGGFDRELAELREHVAQL